MDPIAIIIVVALLATVVALGLGLMTMGGGGAALHVKNENGVILKLSGTTKGISLDISASGMSVEMK